MDGVYVYEFMFRGGESSSRDDDTWHVVLARNSVDILGNKIVETTPALSPARAAELGYTLSSIVSEINENALFANSELKSKVAELEMDSEAKYKKGFDEGSAQTAALKEKVIELVADIRNTVAKADEAFAALAAEKEAAVAASLAAAKEAEAAKAAAAAQINFAVDEVAKVMKMSEATRERYVARFIQ